NPTHNYADTGTYTFKLVINRGEECSDSAVSRIKVYPGFFPDFSFKGICVNKPTLFTDLTSTRYGVVDTWSWDFGVTTINTDISNAQNPSYTYTQLGIKNVRFIVTNSKGCIDTVYKNVEILDKPPLRVAFKDTLICNGDPLQLHAIGNGLFSWTPLSNIVNENTPDPTVTPPTTTKYIVQLDDNGCINKDTVQVRVVDFVTLAARPDTVICAGDSVRLGAFGDGLRYFWTPVAGFANPNVQNPMVRPDVTTTYQVRATIGSCSATDDMRVSLVPYPGAKAGPDTVICFNTTAQIHASITASSFTWSPAGSLSDPASLDPIARPKNTTTYVLTVRDNIGCPKPGFDSITVVVLPKVNAFAGKDTAVVVGQPLQFSASGGVGYTWSPATGLNKINVFNPIGIYDGSFDSIRYKVVVMDEAGCTDSSSIKVKVFRTDPRIFVPSAFTPNGDGKNDYFRPIAVGISRIEYFSVYNRWGQLVFSTTVNEMGWDGTLGGKEQPSGTYVWLVRGVDYTGKVVFAKGTSTLIR
ncbi:MAG TPA: gliding motility-associated C-terminal domain-containing protein, partial [Flavisolibacter sp.]|nr:gliding motility-associated C-terminal domain-containing protein [Flavisolibacter sp.]